MEWGPAGIKTYHRPQEVFSNEANSLTSFPMETARIPSVAVYSKKKNDLTGGN